MRPEGAGDRQAFRSLGLWCLGPGLLLAAASDWFGRQGRRQLRRDGRCDVRRPRRCQWLARALRLEWDGLPPLARTAVMVAIISITGLIGTRSANAQDPASKLAIIDQQSSVTVARDAQAATVETPMRDQGGAGVVIPPSSVVTAELTKPTEAQTTSLALAVAASPSSFTAAGQTITYTYALANTGTVTINKLLVSGANTGLISCAPALPAGNSTTCKSSYLTTAGDISAGGISFSATVTGAPSAAGGLPDAATATASGIVTFIAPSPLEVARQNVEGTRAVTRSAIQQFASTRAGLMTSMAPDSGRMHGRLGAPSASPNAGNVAPPMAFGGMAALQDIARRQPLETTVGDAARDRSSAMAGSLVGLNGDDNAGNGRFAFATSLTQMRQSAASAQAAKDAGSAAPMGLGASTNSSAGPSAAPPQFDIWVQGVGAYYEDDRNGRQRGHVGMLYVGADYIVRPAILIGLLMQIDKMQDASSSASSARGGQGWMAGPYMSAQLTDNVFFDARAAWGQSSNHINPLGSYTDSFATDRGLVSGKLTGNSSWGAFRFRPSAEVAYFQEKQKTYVNQLGIDIPGQTVSLGRATFGPEIGYQFIRPDKSMLEPFVGLKGIWDFARTTDAPTIAGQAVGGEPIRARVEGGVTFKSASGVLLRGSGAYDGIGDSHFRAIQGGVFVIWPIN